VARKPAPAKQSSLTPFYVIIGVVALAGVAALLFQMRDRGSAATEPIPVAIDPAELSRVQGISVGRADAPVVIYEFADFQCPGCGQFASFVAPLIKERLVEPGLVRYVYYDFPLSGHSHAFLASRAARCANAQGRFWEYHDLLYARQASWSGLRDASDFFVELAGAAGLDEGQFEQCLRSDQFAEEVTRSLRLGESLGVQGTPTLFVNGKRLQEIPSFEELERVVRQEAGGAAGAPAAADTVGAAAGA
jgi:protein-disulfide isomerase